MLRDSVKHFLDKRGIAFSANKTHLSVGIQGNSIENFVVKIQILEEERFIRFWATDVVPRLVEPFSRYLFMESVLSLDYKYSLVSWLYDSTNLTAYPYSELALDDAELSEGQFFHYFASFVEYIDEFLPVLLKILNNRVSASEINLIQGEQVLLKLENEAPELLSVIVQAIDARRIRGVTGK